MRCPFCDAEKESLKVIDSRTCEGGRSIRRRRQCLRCNKRFTTYERIEENVRLTVIKRDGRRIPWDRNKILTGLERACFKRPVPENELLRIVEEVEDETFKTHDREVPSTFIGRLVAEKLRRLDQVAYVRFASVYKQFKTLEELVEEARAVLDAKRFEEDPTQGKLFIEAEKQAGAAAGPAQEPQGRNGSPTEPAAAPGQRQRQRPASSSRPRLRRSAEARDVPAEAGPAKA